MMPYITPALLPKSPPSLHHHIKKVHRMIDTSGQIALTQRHGHPMNIALIMSTFHSATDPVPPARLQVVDVKPAEPRPTASHRQHEQSQMPQIQGRG